MKCEENIVYLYRIDPVRMVKEILFPYCGNPKQANVVTGVSHKASDVEHNKVKAETNDAGYEKTIRKCS
uniref:Uncharacterized protein n=1 Tax=Arion vulgaris TaxID=1028688 RepID=A0A0B6ZP28_9EUPU